MSRGDKPRRPTRRVKPPKVNAEELRRLAEEEVAQLEAEEAEAIKQESNVVDIGSDGRILEAPIPLGAPAAHAFPVSVLPDGIRDFVQAMADSFEVPVDLPGMLALGAISAAVQGKWKVSVRPGWNESLNLYIAVAMEPGEQKSSCFRSIFGPLHAYAHTLVEAWKRAVAPLESAASQRKRSEPKVELPPKPRMFVDDATPETVARLMTAHGERLVIASDEGTLFSMICGMYSKTPNNGVFLKAHDGGGYTVDRSDGEKHVALSNPLLTMALAIQPEMLRLLATKPELRGQGMVARFLYSIPKSNIGRKTFDGPPIDWHLRDAYDRIFALLLQSAPSDWTAPTPLRPMERRGKVGTIRFSPDAWEQLKNVCVGIDRQMLPGAKLHAIQDWASKFRGAIARIAGLFHVVRCVTSEVDPTTELVSFEDLQRAMVIGHYLLTHAHRAFATMEAETGERDAILVIEWIKREKLGFVTRRQIQRESPIRKGSKVASAIGLLVDRGYLEEIAKMPLSKGSGYRVIKVSAEQQSEACDTATGGENGDN